MRKFFTKLGNFLTALMTLFFVGSIIAAIGVFYILYHYGQDLPDHTKLAQYEPPTVTRLYASDGRMMEEYAKEKRLFVPINAIPKRLVNAFIAAEDQNFYSHPGIDVISIIRAAMKNVSNIGKNKSLVGGSTITQQVVKNFLLTNEKSFDRKIKEAILAFRITQAFSKDKIMELYLNEIYLGNRSYGVAASSLNYFNKSIDELAIEEAAMLAALPKAPSNLDPSKYYNKAKARRDWVIGRMKVEGFITQEEAMEAIAKPIEIAKRDEMEMVNNAASFSEAVRQELTTLYGEEGVYEKGLAVRTTLSPKLQDFAQDALRRGLLAYDKRHGYKGPIAKIKILEDYVEELEKIQKPARLGNWSLAVITKVDKEHARIAINKETKGIIPLKNLAWARKYISDNKLGDEIEKPSQVVSVGDVVVVRKTSITQGDDPEYFLEQIPEVNGAIVAMDPYTGKVLAMVGGYGYGGSQFNRAVQAKRQPGSAFKPFVYLTALENGFAPNSIIVDEEVQLERGEDLPGWRPQNYSGKYYGPTTLRVGVEKSRNAMTVRLSQLMGINKVVEVAKRFDIYDNPNRDLSVALGSAETTLLRLTNAYAMLVNGGKVISPSLIERIQNSNGKTIYKRDNRTCDDCLVTLTDAEIDSLTPPDVEEYRQQISDPISAFQTVSILEGVVQRGTGRNLKSLEKILAGKTGTTNDSLDGWFMGFSANLAVGVYVGFDTPRSLGRYETGASTALPIWKEFVKNALKDEPDIPFRRPSGIKLVKIDAKTGLLPSPDTPKEQIIFEAFRAGTEPDTTTSSAFEPSLNGNQFIEDFTEGGIY